MAGDDWFTYKVEETDSEGLEPTQLARLLVELSGAFYALARERLSRAPSRPGRRSQDESELAAFRVVRVELGSAVIHFAPPTASAQQRLFHDTPTADDVARDFVHEITAIDHGTPALPARSEVRRRLRSVVEQSGSIGGRATAIYGGDRASVDSLMASVRTREIPVEPAATRVERHAQLSGHTYMVDLEPGRQRVRVKLPDGRDVTMAFDQGLAAAMKDTIDQPVLIDVLEEPTGTVAVQRTVTDVHVIRASSGESDLPPKFVGQLAAERKLPISPDYVSLASAIWPTEEDLVEFTSHIAQIRRPPTVAP